MPFSAYSDQSAPPHITFQELERRAQRALFPLRQDSLVAWQRGAPYFYPAADGSRRWDVYLGPVWTLEGAGEAALRDALPDDIGAILLDSFDDFRLPPDGAERLARIGRAETVERFLYTGQDIAHAIDVYRGRPFLMLNREGHPSIVYPKRLITRVKDTLSTFSNDFPEIGILAHLEVQHPSGTRGLQEVIGIHALAPLAEPAMTLISMNRSADLWTIDRDAANGRVRHAVVVDVDPDEQLRKLIAQASVGLSGFSVIRSDASRIELAAAGGDFRINEPEIVGIGGTLRIWRVVPDGDTLLLVVDDQAPLLEIARRLDVAPRRPYGIRFAFARDEISTDALGNILAMVQEQIDSRQPTLTLQQVRYIASNGEDVETRYVCGLPGAHG